MAKVEKATSDLGNRPRRQRYEHYSQPLLPVQKFLGRLARHGVLAAALVVFSLMIGMLGYHYLAELDWVESFLNASMILTGMGPVDPMHGVVAKVFAGCYALYSGVTFLTAMGVMFAPVLHRGLHKFHLSQ